MNIDRIALQMKYLSRPLLLLACCALLLQCSSDTTPANRLVDASSPYLLLHAHNPVDWYPWSEEALTRARTENKMLIISVGYAACHWCHVMERESFMDEEVAEWMNAHFISIKVDREERPDIDQIYMTACQMSTGEGCGWPLNAFALPDGRPVWAGTYFPKDDWIEILKHFTESWKSNPAELRGYADRLTEGIRNWDVLPPITREAQWRQSALDTLTQGIVSRMDPEEGGLAGAPKFPMPVVVQYLLRTGSSDAESSSHKLAVLSLDRMALSGLYDPVGGGFARYATDEKWQIPHFEKMLFDNALLLPVYAEAWQLTRSPLYERIVRESLAFLEREMRDPTGGFYSSIDAQSEEEEGKFYVWTYTELKRLLGDGPFRRLQGTFAITAEGNWERRQNILWSSPVAHGEDPLSFEEWPAMRSRLMAARDQRSRPATDDKILTSWNALMISAYVAAYRAWGEREYLNKALEIAAFIQTHMLKKDGMLLRNYHRGRTSITGFLDDYAHTIQAWTELYQVTFDEKWLHEASFLLDYVLEHYQSAGEVLFDFNHREQKDLIARKREYHDGVLPSSNAILAQAMFDLGTFLDEEEWKKRASDMMQIVSHPMMAGGSPTSFAQWGQLYHDLLLSPYEVVVIGKNCHALRRDLQSHYLPGVLYLGGDTEGSLELMEGKLMDDDTMIYVCKNKVCKLPVQDVPAAIAQLQRH